MIGWIVLGAVILVLLYVAAAYNDLVRLKVRAENSWSDIDIQLKRRHDLIPNLVETVKGYAAHERGTLDAVITARNRALSAQGPAAKAEAEDKLNGTLHSLFALGEAYPQLRAIEGFTQLQSALSGIEGAIESARRYYNAVVRDFNTKIQQVPSNIIAGVFHFQAREFFEVGSAAERQVPKVSFNAPPV